MTIENSHKGKKYSYITIDYQFILQTLLNILLYTKYFVRLPFPRIIVCMLFGMKCIKFLTKFTDVSLYCSRRAPLRYFLVSYGVLLFFFRIPTICAQVLSSTITVA